MGTYFKKLPGEKVYLSPLDPDDAPIYCRWLADLEVSRFIISTPMVLGLAGERDYLVRLAQGQNEFAIVDAASNKLIGGCGFVAADPVQRSAEVGIFIGDKDFWGKGCGSEALRLLLDFGFNVRNYHNILIRAKSFNTRAIRCYEKLGFKQFGSRRECNLNGETYTDEVYMDLLAGEFNGQLAEALTRSSRA